MSALRFPRLVGPLTSGCLFLIGHPSMIYPPQVPARAVLIAALCAVFPFAVAPGSARNASAETGDPDDPPPVGGFVYLDLGYLRSDNRPANHTWRSKGTTYILDRLKVNNATAFLEKEAVVASRWGFQVGLQAGVDPDGGARVDHPVSAAETLAHLYYTNLSYLLPAGRGLALTGGLIPGHPGYPDFHALHNPSYTRPYQVDTVPYFLWGVEARYPAEGKLTAAFLLVSGYEYLEAPNDAPSYGLQVVWQAAPELSFNQNVYYGPDQERTTLEFWRFLTNTVGEWRFGEFLLAGSFTATTEKRATLVGTPRHSWTALALWLQWQSEGPWRLALRPELFDDPDGLATGFRQTIRAVAVTGEYRRTLGNQNTLSARLEYRFDRSTGDQGGFYAGADNRLVPEQNLLIGAILWRFDFGR
jgi:hypothetical protein